METWKQAFPQLNLSYIGKIVAGERITLRDKNGVPKLGMSGYSHFD